MSRRLGTATHSATEAGSSAVGAAGHPGGIEAGTFDEHVRPYDPNVVLATIVDRELEAHAMNI